MAQEELEIEIDPSGKVTMRTKGVKGPVCMEYADLLARIVGREESREKTHEHFEAKQRVAGAWMQCSSCGFENMPGSEACARCASSLSLATAVMDVHPPRAGRFA